MPQYSKYYLSNLLLQWKPRFYKISKLKLKSARDVETSIIFSCQPILFCLLTSNSLLNLSHQESPMMNNRNLLKNKQSLSLQLRDLKESENQLDFTLQVINLTSCRLNMEVKDSLRRAPNIQLPIQLMLKTNVKKRFSIKKKRKRRFLLLL